MRRPWLPLLLLAFSVPAGAGPPKLSGIGSLRRSPRPPTVVSEEVVAELAKELGEAAGPEWRLHRDGDSIFLARDISVFPEGGFSRDSVETRTYLITITLSPPLGDAAQGAKLEAATRLERKLWRTVARIECQEKEFNDHYEDGLCFRPKTEADDQKVKAYRQARMQLAEVPRFHRERAFAASIVANEPQLVSAPCEECRAAVRKLGELMTAYPSRPSP